MTRPNLLLIVCDQLRWDALGCTGGVARTPHIDALAREGVSFVNCVTTSPQCVPARLSFATGLYPHHTGVWSNQQTDLPPGRPTWMRALRDAGYRTSLIGKSHLHRHVGDLREREPLMAVYGYDDVDEIAGPTASMTVDTHMTALWKREGWFDAYCADYRDRFAHRPWVARASPLPLSLYADVYVGSGAARYLDAYDDARPWCCTVGFSGPHDPWDAPEPFASLYPPASMPLPRFAPQDVAERPRGEFDRHFLEQRQRLKPTPTEIAALRANYAGRVTLIDGEVGRVMDVVRARGELDRTVVIFTSDHGEMNGDAGLLYKSTFLDGAVRVPLFVRAPGAPMQGSMCTAPVEWFDAAATLVDFGGAGMATSQARSLRPMLDDVLARTRREAISEFKHEVMLLDEDWKGVVNRQGDVYQLFDVRHDRDERRNLAGDPALAGTARAIASRIVARLRASVESKDSPRPPDKPAAFR